MDVVGGLKTELKCKISWFMFIPKDFLQMNIVCISTSVPCMQISSWLQSRLLHVTCELIQLAMSEHMCAL